MLLAIVYGDARCNTAMRRRTLADLLGDVTKSVLMSIDNVDGVAIFDGHRYSGIK